MDDKEKIIRTFFALDLPGEVKNTIYNLYNPLKNESKIKIKWITPENLHLTIKFLGNIPEKRLDKIIKNIENLKLNINIEMAIDSYGVFPPKGIPKVFWISFKEKEGNNELVPLFKKVEQELVKLGFDKEKRRFTPHLTIARLKLKSKKKSEEFNKLLEIFKGHFNKTEKGFFTIDKLTLFKSELKPSGAVYSKIREF